MSLSKQEWDEITELVCEMANSSLQNNFDRDSLSEILLGRLAGLREKHGDLPILLTTKADYIDDIDERLDLYKKAIELSKDGTDVSCLTQSAESIVEIYIEDTPDYESGLYWLNQLKVFVSKYGDKHILNKLCDLEADLNRVRIKSV